MAQREKVLYVAGISGSNDTTGKDCVRYGFRQCFYGQTAAAAIGPVLLKAYGKGKKAAYLTPDYTYGHTVQKSMEDYLGKNGGWTTVTNQVAPLGAPVWPIAPWLGGTMEAALGNVFGQHLQGFQPDLLRYSGDIGITTVGVGEFPSRPSSVAVRRRSRRGRMDSVRATLSVAHGF